MSFLVMLYRRTGKQVSSALGRQSSRLSGMPPRTKELCVPRKYNLQRWDKRQQERSPKRLRGRGLHPPKTGGLSGVERSLPSSAAAPPLRATVRVSSRDPPQIVQLRLTSGPRSVPRSRAPYWRRRSIDIG